jgi:RNA polymerase sigma-70 factor (ECF subfamily)
MVLDDQPDDAPPASDEQSTAGGGESLDFAAVLLELQEPLVRYAYRFVKDLEEAQDLVQEAFLRLHKETLKPDGFSGQASSWLYRVTHNLAMDHLRREKHAHAYREKLMEKPVTTTAQPPDLARQEGEQRAWEHLKKLSERDQQVVLLKVEHDLSYKEIAAVLEISVSNVGYILHHALKNLGTMLKEEGAV